MDNDEKPDEFIFELEDSDASDCSTDTENIKRPNGPATRGIGPFSFSKCQSIDEPLPGHSSATPTNPFHGRADAISTSNRSSYAQVAGASQSPTRRSGLSLVESIFGNTSFADLSLDEAVSLHMARLTIHSDDDSEDSVGDYGTTSTSTDNESEGTAPEARNKSTTTGDRCKKSGTDPNNKKDDDDNNDDSLPGVDWVVIEMA